MTNPEHPNRGPSLLDYIRSAFFFRWNLLALFGGVGAALLSGHADVALPLVAAAELSYLAGLTAFPKFRAAVDAQIHAQNNPPPATEPAPDLQTVLNGLITPARQRFERLRTRCLEMQKIAASVRTTGPLSRNQPSLAQATAGLDRLLWVFIRLLYAQQAFQRFLTSTDVGAMTTQLDSLRRKFEDAKNRNDDRLIKSLTDSIATAELRLENVNKARENIEFVAVELDRIEGKIQALVEMAVSHEDPDYLTSQVDSVAESMAYTESAIRDMDHITGFNRTSSQAPPAILAAELGRVVE
ncbi:MAG: hypothetical protein HUU55_02035 [Myxococcales bacterium]|nr:hypothetical protein [Myxococcales bacterium]